MHDYVTKALAALRKKDFLEALKFINMFAENHPFELQHYLIKGLAELALNKWISARDTFFEAKEQFPHQSQLWFNLGVAQENIGDLTGAADSLEYCLELASDQGLVCGNLSNIYRKQGRFKDAETLAHRAFEMGAPKAQSLNTLALAIAKQGRIEAAEKIFREVLQQEPLNHEAMVNLANLFVEQLKFSEAWPLYSAARSTSDNPAIRRDEGMARLLAGEYSLGWTLFEARLELPFSLRVHPSCPMYKGESLTGKKLLLLAEQGYGDAIQFCRYGKLLVDEGASLVWSVPSNLVRLFSYNIPGTVISEQDVIPRTDYYLPLMSLPHATNKLAFSEAPVSPYFLAPQQPKLDPLSTALKIGLVWSGSPTHENDHQRSVSLKQLSSLFTIPKTKYYTFLANRAHDNVDQFPILKLDNFIADFADTAALIMGLDCIVTIDTSVAHLAGALGKKTYLLLPFCPDWRWGISGDSTPWYSSITILRQKHAGDWGGVITQLESILIKAANSRGTNDV